MAKKQDEVGAGAGAVDEAAAKAAAEAKQAAEKKAAETAAAKAKKAEEKAAAKAAKDAEKAAAKKAKEDAIAAKKAQQMPEQNGIRRPRPEGKCGQAWAMMDAMSGELGSPVPVGDVVTKGEAAGLNAGNIRAEYARWKKFHGITGRIAKPAKAEAAPATTEAAPAV